MFQRYCRQELWLQCPIPELLLYFLCQNQSLFCNKNSFEFDEFCVTHNARCYQLKLVVVGSQSEIKTDDFVVDSSSSDFLEENTNNSTDNLQESSELEEEVPVAENDDILNALDEEDDFNDEPASEVFNSQWDSLDIMSETEETDSQENDNPIAITMEELVNARLLAETQENETVAPVEPEEVVLEKPASTVDNLSDDLKKDVKSVLEYMDKLLINLPEEKIKEFAASDHFEVYKKLFSELGLE